MKVEQSNCTGRVFRIEREATNDVLTPYHENEKRHIQIDRRQAGWRRHR